MKTILYTFLAVVVPVAWGLLSAWAFDRLRLRRQCKAQDRGSDQTEKAE